MRKALMLIAVGTLLWPASLSAADYCDDKIEQGESIDGKAMVLMGSLMFVALAERYCAAAPMPYSQVFVVVEEMHGCGPRARLETKVEGIMKELGPITTDTVLRWTIFADDENISRAEMDRRAKTDIKKSDCDEMLKIRDNLQQGYRNPPKWPPEPRK